MKSFNIVRGEKNVGLIPDVALHHFPARRASSHRKMIDWKMI